LNALKNNGGKFWTAGKRNGEGFHVSALVSSIGRVVFW
jgi:hypothetical protein